MFKEMRENWDSFDYLLCGLVWAVIVYFCASFVPCAQADECGSFALWFFGLTVASTIPAAVVITGLVSLLRGRKK